MKYLKWLPSFLLAVHLNAIAELQIILIGGGDEVESSHGEFESNAIWLNGLLPQVGGHISHYYASGNGDEKDVARWVMEAEQGAMTPLSRVFVGGNENRRNFVHNVLTDVEGGTGKTTLIAALQAKFTALRPGDEVLVVFNGHGEYNADDPHENYLRLWGGDLLSVSEVDALFDLAPAESTIRFIFPQDYSGAFSRLVYDNPHSKTLAAQRRCGFLAQSPGRRAETSRTSPVMDEFYDYLTYYFTPLYSKTREGNKLPNEPDLDGNGLLSYREGHLYALRNAQGTERARSTSEAFLEEWEPWFLRWDTLDEHHDSQYWLMAKELAGRNALNLDGQVLRQREAVLRKQWQQLHAEKRSIKEETRKLKAQLQEEVIRRWPELSHPYSDGYRRVIQEELEKINELITRDRRYPILVRAQDALMQVEKDGLSYERRMAEVDRIIRYKKLARLEKQFDRFANAEAKSAYKRLLACENDNLAKPVAAASAQSVETTLPDN